MQRSLAGLTIALAVSLMASVACGAEAPVLLTHEVTGYRVEGNAVTVAYLLHVNNRLGKPLSELTLTFLPNPAQKQRIVLKVAALGAEGSTDLSFQVQGIALPPRQALQRQRLTLGGECRDAEGKVLEFPVVSYPGGAL
jgi:hypothetical protein